MFDFLKTAFNISLYSKVYKEIKELYKLKNKNLLIAESGELDSAGNMLKHANIKFIDDNLDILYSSIDLLMRDKLLKNNIFKDYQIKEIMKFPLFNKNKPIIIETYCKKIEISKSLDYYTLHEKESLEFKKIDKQLWFYKESKLNLKFKYLYLNKIFLKLVRIITKYDKLSADYITTKIIMYDYQSMMPLYIKNLSLNKDQPIVHTKNIQYIYNNIMFLKSIIFKQLVYKKISEDNNILYKTTLILRDEIDNNIIEYIKASSRFETILFIIKRN